MKKLDYKLELNALLVLANLDRLAILSSQRNAEDKYPELNELLTAPVWDGENGAQ